MSRGRGTASKVVILNSLRERDGLICGICNGSLEEEWKSYEFWLSSPKSKLIKRKNCNLTIDHKFPKSLVRKQEDFVYSKGWWFSDLDNLQLAHGKCNNEKGNTYPHPIEYEDCIKRVSR